MMEKLILNKWFLLFLFISDRSKSRCPECHPCIAGCVVVTLILFSIYHADSIKAFASSIFHDKSNAFDSGPATESIKQHLKVIDHTETEFAANDADQNYRLSILLISLAMLPMILMSHI